MFISDKKQLERIVLSTMAKISQIVGATLGPGGKNVLIESDYPGLPNKNTKDGVTVFKSLGANNSFEHLIIEQTRDSAQRTASEAGDGPQPLWSKVLTPKGFIEMKDVEVGMEVCGTDGTTQKVLGVFPKGEKEIYTVTFSGGRVVECCADHLWSVTTSRGVKKTITTGQMAVDFKKTSKDGYDNYKYYTPRTIVEFKGDEDLPLDPYFLGLLIGDGSLRDSGAVELSLGKKKEHILEKIPLPKGLYLDAKFYEDKNYYRVKIKGETKDGKTIRELVEEVGLRNKGSDDKFIPSAYLMSSVKNREALLQGLLDTDGHINVRGNFEFSTVSENLYKDFVFLARSLGKSLHTIKWDRKEDDNSYSDKSIYRVTELDGYKNGDKIIGIEATGRRTEMKCIKVSNPNSLYLTDGFIVTHNTTSSTILSAAMVENLYDFCNKNPRFSPQKVARDMSKTVRNVLVPMIQSMAIKIDESNLDLLRMVAKISANGDDDMADAVMKAFELLGYGENSHVTIKEVGGPYGYEVGMIEGFPIPIGYEESIGKFHNAFVNDPGNQRIALEDPKFLLFDGMLNDLLTIQNITEIVSQEYNQGKVEYKNLVIFAHGYSDTVLNNLSFNFIDGNTINVVPMVTPRAGFINAQTHFLNDLAAFTGAKVFGLKDSVASANLSDLGSGMKMFEGYRFRSTIVGEPDSLNIEVRAEELSNQKNVAESKEEKLWLEERMGKLTSGIAKLTIYGGSNGELKEAHDRCEDAVCAVRAAIGKGALPGGCRALINLFLEIYSNESIPNHVKEVLAPSLIAPFGRLLDNAGIPQEEAEAILDRLIDDKDLVYDVENQKFGKWTEMGVFDALPAVEEALKNAASIASVMGTIGGMVAYPRDNEFERQEAAADAEFQRMVENPSSFTNEAENRI